nr:Crotonase domain containing protein [Haemonchus contortus]
MRVVSSCTRTLLLRSKNLLTVRSVASQPDPFVMETLSGSDEGIVLFRMNRPQTKNAISKLFLEQLKESISSVKFSKSVRVVILKSDVEGAFCTGADLKERKSMPVEDVPKFVDSLRSSFSELERLPQPVIAAIDGYALGGGLEMALACDIRGTQRLTRAVGQSMAKELIFTGRMISGEEACRIGLVNHCTKSDAFAKAMEIAREIVPRGPLAVRLAKIAIDTGSQMDLNSGLVVEQQCYAQCSNAAVGRAVKVGRYGFRSADTTTNNSCSDDRNRKEMEEEHEKSLLCNFELKSRHDEKLMEKRAELEREGKELSELDEQIGIANSIIQDEWKRRGEQLVKSLKLDNPRSHEVKDERSLQRILDRKLLLIVQQRFGQENYRSPWILPQLKHEAGETLRETTERCLRQIADDVKASLYGNAPFAVFSHRYPKPLSKRLEKDGAKLFFFNAVLEPSSLFTPNKKEVVDYKWVVREEFWSTVPSKKYKSCIDSIFIE